MTDNPWTPGPWTHESCIDIEGDQWDWLRCPDGDQPHYGETSHDVRTPEQGAINTTLMALAPEMAEAILRWKDNEGVTADLRTVAAKLRQIGAPDA